MATVGAVSDLGHSIHAADRSPARWAHCIKIVSQLANNLSAARRQTGGGDFDRSFGR
jgi:hypothetical protein